MTDPEYHCDGQEKSKCSHHIRVPVNVIHDNKKVPPLSAVLLIVHEMGVELLRFYIQQLVTDLLLVRGWSYHWRG